MLPHWRASWNLIFSSLTKCRATSGKPFFCRYAIMDFPTSLPERMMRTTVLYLRLVTATLYMYSVGSILAAPHFFSRLRKWSSVELGEIWQMYTGSSTVRMMPLSPFGKRYLMWVAVLYTNVSSSQAPLLMREFSNVKQHSSRLDLAMWMLLFENMATNLCLADQTTYLIGWRLWMRSSPTIFIAWISYRTMESGVRRSMRPSPAGKMWLITRPGMLIFFFTSFFRSRCQIWRFLSRTQKRVRETNAALLAKPLWVVCLEKSFPRFLSVTCSSYVPIGSNMSKTQCCCRLA
mmetsp:Transcript_9114/g.17848  ORF Transcript_9114/g.17848 Transcript_9114/m.17848 type:complete len:291 (+) Transcript_9114:194-1066(+)